MKDRLGHGSNPGTHSAGIVKLPKLGRAAFQQIAQNLFGQKPQDPNDLKANTAFSDRLTAAADKLAMTNPGFNRQKFIEAASGKKPQTKMPRSRAGMNAGQNLFNRGHF